MNGPAVTVEPETEGTSTASCPAGSQPTGGGVGFATDPEMEPVEFHTVNALGFTVIAFNPDPLAAHTLQATVACARR